MTSDEHNALAKKYADEAPGYNDPGVRMYVMTLAVIHGVAADIIERLEKLGRERCHEGESPRRSSEPS